MGRVEEARRPNAGLKRPASGFLESAASLFGFGRRFADEESTSLGAGRVTFRAAASQGRPSAPEAQVASPSEPAPRQDEAAILSAHVAALRTDGRARRVLVTHSGAAEAPLAGLDCAALASRIARDLAEEGRTILVIFGSGGGMRPGMSELVDGSASFSEAIHREAGSRLHILPSGHGPVSPGPGLNVVLDALRDTYDFVVLSAVDDERDALRRLAIALAPRADHAFIACFGQTGSPDMVALRDALKDEGAGEVVATRMGVAEHQSRAAA